MKTRIKDENPVSISSDDVMLSPKGGQEKV